MTTITLRTPNDAIASVPYLLGFTPEYAVVLLGIKGNALYVTMHIEAHKMDGLDAAAFAALADCDSMLGLAYAESFAVAEALAQQTPTLGVAPLTDFLLVAGGRQRSMLCSNASCCPPEGTPLSPAPEAEAELVLAGSAPVASRDDLYAELSAAPAGSIVPALADLMLDVGMRDRYMAAACESIPTTQARAAEVRNALAATPADAEARPELLAVAAMMAYLCGDGARANVAIDVLTGEYGQLPNLARLVDAALSVGMDPATLRSDLAEMEV
jgi:hypothetical protein